MTPYGIYDVAANASRVNVGLDHDPAAFAMATVRRWWEERGQQRYPHATGTSLLALAEPDVPGLMPYR